MVEFCESYINLSPSQKEDQLDWSLYENGTLYSHSENIKWNAHKYCFDLDMNDDGTFYVTPLACYSMGEKLQPIERISNWTLVISIQFILLTIVAYCCLPELRGVHGKCFISYLICLALSNGILSYVNLTPSTIDTDLCFLLGYLHYYFLLCFYAWLGIISYNIWQQFSHIYCDTSYLKFMPLGWLVPMLITCLAFIAQHLGLDDKLMMGINEEHCGLDVNRMSAIIYLYGPCLLTLIFCLFAFILTTRHINAKGPEVFVYTNCVLTHPKKRFSIYLRLFILMGLSWFLDVLAYILFLFRFGQYSAYVDFINDLQGFYIFLCFICRQRVRNIIKERLNI